MAWSGAATAAPLLRLRRRRRVAAALLGLIALVAGGAGFLVGSEEGPTWHRGVASVLTPYGTPLACGGRLQTDTLGVAHRTMPCGTELTFRRRARTITVPVVDRGPYVAGRDFDLTPAAAGRLRLDGVASLDWHR